MRERARKDADEHVARVKAEGETQRQEQLASTQGQIRAEVDKAMGDLRTAVAEMTVAASEKVLRGSPTPSSTRRSSSRPSRSSTSTGCRRSVPAREHTRFPHLRTRAIEAAGPDASRVADELDAFAAIATDAPVEWDQLVAPGIPAAARKSTIDRFLADAHLLVRNVLKVLVDNGRLEGGARAGPRVPQPRAGA